jgi:hypothetical protein
MARTTFRLDAELLAEVKAFAARRRRTLNSVMEDALRQLLATARQVEERPPVDLVTWPGQLWPGTTLSPEGMQEIRDREDAEHYLEVAAGDADGR